MRKILPRQQIFNKITSFPSIAFHSDSLINTIIDWIYTQHRHILKYLSYTFTLLGNLTYLSIFWSLINNINTNRILINVSVRIYIISIIFIIACVWMRRIGAKNAKFNVIITRGASREVGRVFFFNLIEP